MGLVTHDDGDGLDCFVGVRLVLLFLFSHECDCLWLQNEQQQAGHKMSGLMMMPCSVAAWASRLGGHEMS